MLRKTYKLEGVLTQSRNWDWVSSKWTLGQTLAERSVRGKGGWRLLSLLQECKVRV